MSSLQDLLGSGPPAPDHPPWRRVAADAATWQQAIELLRDGRLTLLGLWNDQSVVHMALLDESEPALAMLSYRCEADRYPSVARLHPPAIRLERALHDLTGLTPEGLTDTRAWLDHGTWPVAAPLGPLAGAAAPRHPYEFLAAEGESLHQIPVGPVHAGIIEPGHFRFSASGETVVRLEQRLGYVHKGIESLLTGATLERAAALAGRVSGDSTVAFSLAFAFAVEAACGSQVPARAVWLRALMAELERLANHFGDIGAICNDAAFALLHAQCGYLRELTLRSADACFGHRLMMDRIIPGGVRCDLQDGGAAAVTALLAHVRGHFPELVELYDNTASLQDRTVGTGVLTAELARQYGAGGYVGRGSGRGFDARRTPGYPPYDQLEFEVPVRTEGDVDARIWIRILEVEQSLKLIDQILARMPSGPISTAVTAALPGTEREGVALVEGFRGDILVWLRTNPDGTIARCHLRDPSWFQWPLLEAVIEGNIVADFPLCNKSFNCSYSGHDL